MFGSIPEGEGYIYVRKDKYDNYTANLICEMAARKRKLNLQISHDDARYWWITGMVPYRVTPKEEGLQQTPSKNIYSEADRNNMNDQQKKEVLNYLIHLQSKKDK